MSTLSPSTSLLRRPSSAADFILSRGATKDSLAQPLPSPSRSLSPSESTHSASLGCPCAGWPSPGGGKDRGGAEGSLASLGGPSPGGERSASGGSPSTESTPCSSRAVSPLPSPEVRRRYWLKKLIGMKDDIDRIGVGFRQARANIRGNIVDALARLSPKGARRRAETVQGATLTCGVKVEVIRDSPTRRRGRLRRLQRAGGEGVESTPSNLADHNFSMFLMLTNLKDGMFSAELPMDKMPHGNVRIRVRDYKLEVMVVKSQRDVTGGTTTSSCSATDDVTAARPVYCGSISIPIYVNPTTLKFRLNESGTLLSIEGRMKGVSCHQRLCLSTSDLRAASCAVEGQYLGVPGGSTAEGWSSCAISLSGSTEELDARVPTPVPSCTGGAGGSSGTGGTGGTCSASRRYIGSVRSYNNVASRI